MSEHAPADRRAVGSAVAWVLATTLAIAGCSAGSGNSTAPPGTQSSTSSSAPTTPSSSPASSSAAPFKQDPVDAAFAKRLDALCQDWNNVASYHQYPVVADPQAATVQELAKIGEWVDSLPMNRELVAKAAGLGAPTAGTEAWGRVLADFALYETSIATAAAAAKAGNVQAWKPAEESWSAARETVREDLVKAGVGAQSTCSFLFARPAGHGN